MRKDRQETDLGRIASWTPGDDDGAPSKSKFVGDTHDDRWRDVLLWLFLPSLVGAMSIWVLLHSWFDLSIGYGWAIVAIDLVLYMLIGWRGRQLFLFVSRSVRRNS